jgi:hypothetical protein
MSKQFLFYIIVSLLFLFYFAIIQKKRDASACKKREQRVSKDIDDCYEQKKKTQEGKNPNGGEMKIEKKSTKALCKENEKCFLYLFSIDESINYFTSLLSTVYKAELRIPNCCCFYRYS